MKYREQNKHKSYCRIYGKHSILNAYLNPERNYKVYFGKLENYKKLNINCKFFNHIEDFLETEEYYVPSEVKEFYQHQRILLLDGLMDPRNVGAIIRTAAAMGFYIILRKQRGCPINETVVECASGGVDQTKIIELASINNFMDEFKKRGFWIAGLHETGSIFLDDYRCPEKLLLVIGSESEGISQIMLKSLDSVIRINTMEFSTLNASVAAAISMYKLKL